MASSDTCSSSSGRSHFVDILMEPHPNLVNACIIVSITVFLSYLGYLVAHRVKNLLWYISMQSVNIAGPISDCANIYGQLLIWLQSNASVCDLPHTHILTHSRREDSGKVVTEIKKNPTFGPTQYFEYKGHWIFVQRERLPGVVYYDQTYETVSLSTFRWNAWILEELLEEVRELFTIEPVDVETKTRFYFANEGYWSECGSGKRKRPLSSVILNESILKKVHGDVKEFLGSATWYQDRGIPYRRGYLLYGPPGCGKSSFVKSIAGEISFDICILSLSSKNLNDDSLNNLMNSTPENCIILLEDVDVAFPSRASQESDDESDNEGGKKKKKSTTPSIENSENGSGRVTLKGLLNALDGVASTEGRIVFLTTNYIDRLDSAMTRPGRVDLKVLIDYPDDDQLERMFTRFYPEAATAITAEVDELNAAKEFVRRIRNVKDLQISMAMVQGHFMMHKNDYKAMLENIESYFADQFASLK